MEKIESHYKFEKMALASMNHIRVKNLHNSLIFCLGDGFVPIIDGAVALEKWDAWKKSIVGPKKSFILSYV